MQEALRFLLPDAEPVDRADIAGMVPAAAHRIDGGGGIVPVAAEAAFAADADLSRLVDIGIALVLAGDAHLDRGDHVHAAHGTCGHPRREAVVLPC